MIPIFLIALQRRARVQIPDEEINLWVLEALTAGAIITGLFLILLASLLEKSLELGKAPKHLSGERDANDGQMLALAGMAFAIFAIVAQFGLAMPRPGVVFLISAALVFTFWGVGRVLLACGGSENAARRL